MPPPRASRRSCPAAGVRLLAPVEANEIFADMAPQQMDVLEKEGIRFFRRGTRLARFVCRWDTSDAEIRALVNAAGRVRAPSSAA